MMPLCGLIIFVNRSDRQPLPCTPSRWTGCRSPPRSHRAAAPSCCVEVGWEVRVKQTQQLLFFHASHWTQRSIFKLTSWRKPRRWKPAPWRHSWCIWRRLWCLGSRQPLHLKSWQATFNHCCVSVAYKKRMDKHQTASVEQKLCCWHFTVKVIQWWVIIY